MKKFILAIVVTAFSVMPANASNLSTKDLGKYICVDQRGIHHNWKSAFDGTTYCKLIPNPSYK
jgi:hypothetical protein